MGEQATEWLTVSEAARLAGLSRNTIRRYDNQGILRAHRTPKDHRRYRREDVERLIRLTDEKPEAS